MRPTLVSPQTKCRFASADRLERKTLFDLRLRLTLETESERITLAFGTNCSSGHESGRGDHLGSGGHLGVLDLARDKRARERIDAEPGACGLAVLVRARASSPRGHVEHVVRAKQPLRLPVVLSREEVTRVLSHLEGTMWIIGLHPRLQSRGACRHEPGGSAHRLSAWTLAARLASRQTSTFVAFVSRNSRHTPLTPRTPRLCPT